MPVPGRWPAATRWPLLPGALCGAEAATERFRDLPALHVTVQEDCRNIRIVGQGQCQLFASIDPRALQYLKKPGVHWFRRGL